MQGNSGFAKKLLPSGLKVLVEEIPYVRSVAVGVWVAVGSRYEKEDDQGVSHFIEHLLFKGTSNRSSQEIAETIDNLGGHLCGATSRGYTFFYAHVLDERLGLVLELIGDMLLHSVFDPQELELERQVVLEEIKTVEDSPEEYIHDMLSEVIWPKSSLGRPILGTTETISRLARDHICRYFGNFYHPENFILTVAGRTSIDQVAEQAERYFPTRPKIVGQAATFSKPEFCWQTVRQARDLEQVHLCLGLRGLRQAHEKRFAGFLLNTILGNGNSSRLFQEVREKRGLVYTIYSGSEAYRDTGMSVVYASCSPDSYQEVIDIILAELGKLREQRVGEEELQRAKNQLKASITLGMESTLSIMITQTKYEFYFGRRFSLDEILKQIDQVTAREILELAQKIFQEEQATLITLGPVKEKFSL